MRSILATLAFSSFLALGFSAVSAPAQAAALPAGSSAARTVATLDAAGGADIVEVSDRRRHWNRHHRYDRRSRHRGPRGGVYYDFGPRYVQPPHVRPRYVRPPYTAPRPAYRLPAAHVNWCYSRYRSYRASDNTFQPYHGSRRACVSPYWR